VENTLVHLIPEWRLPAVEAALSQTFGWNAIDSIEQLSGGLSGSGVYKLTINYRPYVLKLDAPSVSGNPALALASSAGIAPRLHFQDISAGITITDFIESAPIRTTFSPEKLVVELAKTIRSIHSLPCNLPGPDLQETIAAMVAGFAQSKILTGPVVQECFAYYAAIAQKYPWRDSQRVLSHNDLNPANLLSDGNKLWIVDWDAAFSNDRYVDLATAANFFIHTEEQETQFLQVYFDGGVNEYKSARFYIMRQISRIIYAILLVQVAVRNKPAGHPLDQEMEGNTLQRFSEWMAAGKLSMATHEGQLMYGKAQMNEALRQMRSPRFAAALGLLQD